MKHLLKNKKVIVVAALTIVFGILFYISNNQKEKSPFTQQQMKEAIIYFNQTEDYEKALILAKEYVSLYPDDTEGLVHRGYAYVGLGKCVEAKADFLRGSMNGNEKSGQLLQMIEGGGVCK